jgi:protein-tyrosine phosphatase
MVLFVCTGNTCRSPLAEAVARSLVKEGRVDGMTSDDVCFFSAGLAAMDGAPASSEVAEVLAKRGIEYDSRSIRLTPDMVRNADLVLAMTRSHKDGVRYLVSSDENADSHIHLVDPAGDIDDPIGQGLESYESIADRLENILPGRLQELLS